MLQVLLGHAQAFRGLRRTQFLDHHKEGAQKFHVRMKSRGTEAHRRRFNVRLERGKGKQRSLTRNLHSDTQLAIGGGSVPLR